MVAVEAMQLIQMQGDAAMRAQGLKKFAQQFAIKAADPLGWQVDPPNQIGPRRQIQCTAHQRIIHWQQAAAIALNAFFVAHRLYKRLSQRDASIFDGVMIVYMMIALGADRQVEHRMTGQLIKHMIKKSDTGLIVICTCAIEVEVDGDLGLGSGAGNFGGAHGVLIL